MEEVLSSFALVAGVTAVIVPTVVAMVNVTRLFRSTGDHLVLKVGNEHFVIDVSSIDRADINVIDSATRAVQQKADAIA